MTYLNDNCEAVFSMNDRFPFKGGGGLRKMSLVSFF